VGNLAINGGEPVRKAPYPAYITIGEKEKRAAMAVLDTSVLSKFLGTWSPEFYGGPMIQGLEQEWAACFGVKHAVSMNSATSGLYAAVGAAGVGPGDEVIVSPYTMSASATAAVVYGGLPVFADIDPDIFCISPGSIEGLISPSTKAIIVVDLFGHPADMDEIMALARDHGLVVIEDAAQAPGALYKGRPAGTLADMGVFSLNYHKTIHCGEGGIVVTASDDLSERLQLIRNHGEVVVKGKGVQDITNLVGFNYRMTEIEAAIAREQLKKLDGLTAGRIHAAEYLTRHLSGIDGIHPPCVRPRVKHGYYVYALRFEEEKVGIARDRFVAAMNAEGIPLIPGYQEPLYLEPMYQKKIAFGRDGFPFTYSGYRGKVSYEKGICPITERMHEKELMYTPVCHANVGKSDLDDFVTAVQKCLKFRNELR